MVAKDSMCERCFCPVEIIPDKTIKIRQLWDTGRADWWGEPGQYMINTHPMIKLKLCYYHNKIKKGLINENLYY